jgi:uncharacterized protein (DUF433 family)
MKALSTNEVVALFDLDDRRVRKEVEHGVLEAPRFDLPSIVYLRTLNELGFEMSAVEDRKRLRLAIYRAMKGMSSTLRVALSSITELKLDLVLREVKERLERFYAWKETLVVDDSILGGEPVFPGSRLAVRHVGGMLLRGAPIAEVREDYAYLSDEDLEFARLYARAYPRMGRPRDEAAAR